MACCRHRAWQRQLRFALVWILFILMALFYSIPIGAVQAIIEVNRLSKIPGFKQLVSISFIRSIIQAILPGEIPRPSAFRGTMEMIFSFAWL